MASKATDGRSRTSARVPLKFQLRPDNQSMTLGDAPGSDGVVTRYVTPTGPRPLDRPRHADTTGMRLVYGRPDMRWRIDRKTDTAHYVPTWDHDGIAWR